MAQLLVRTTSIKYNAFNEEQKNELRNSLVFLTDTLQILVDGVYYGLSSDDANRLGEVISKVDNISYFGKVSDGNNTYELTPQLTDDKPYKATLKIKGLDDALVTVDNAGFNVKVTITEGTQLGHIRVNDREVKVHGIDTAAYKPESFFYTSVEGGALENRVTTAETNIQNLTDTKVSTITGNQVITVDNTNVTNPILGFKTDNSATNVGTVNFTVSDNGLAGLVDVPFKDISANDKILTLADNGHLSTTIGISYTKRTPTTAAKIVLTGKDGSVLGEIDATDFVVDGMLSEVTLTDRNEAGVAGQWLKMTWNTDSTKDPKTIYVDMKGLIDIYTGKNLILENISIAETDRTDVKNGMSVDTAIGNIILNIRDLQESGTGTNDAFEAFKNRPEGFATAAQGTKADSAIQTIKETNTSDYITVGATVIDNNIELIPVLTVGEMNKEDKGLAEVTDVKNYINEILSWEII